MSSSKANRKSQKVFRFLTLLHSERPKLYTILAFLSAVGLKVAKIMEVYFSLFTEPEPPAMYFCTHCKASFDTGAELKNHHKHHNIMECSYPGCNRKFTWPAHFKYHQLTHK